jgi:hypothetical protein
MNPPAFSTEITQLIIILFHWCCKQRATYTIQNAQQSDILFTK